MPTASQFRHQHVTPVPPGYRVRTFHAGKHQIRVAFPKGTRKRGFGQLISILHPQQEKNPMCGGHLKPMETEISAIQIPLEVTGNGFGPGFEKALVETDRKNPMEVQEYWEKFKAKISELIEKAKDHDPETASNPIKRSVRGAVIGQAKLKRLGGGFFSRGDEYWRFDLGSYTYNVKKGKGFQQVPVKPFYVDKETGRVINPERPELSKNAVLHTRNYTEQVKTSEGKTVFINVDETSKGWRAEGYPVIGERIKRVGKPKVAYGESEADAYDALVMKLEKNPRAKKNLDEIDEAAALAGKFKGSPAKGVHEVQASLEKHRDDFAHLAWLYELVFHPAYDRVRLNSKEVAGVFHELYANDRTLSGSVEAWKKTAERFNTVFLVFDFSGDEIELVSTAKGEQLEFIGGNQASFAEHLSVFRVKPKHDRDDLGDVVGITYLAKKEQFGDTSQRPYYHVFGEDGGSFPRAFFDELNKRIVLTGGSYRLNEPELGIIN